MPDGITAGTPVDSDPSSLPGDTRASVPAPANVGNSSANRCVLQVDDEFRDIIPPLSSDEYATLEANVLADGCRDPLVVWNGVIIDGHNRHRICTEHGVAFKTTTIDFPDRDAATDWIIRNQLGRRNLTREQRAYLIGKRYEAQKKAPHGRADRDFWGGQNAHPKTAQKIAEEERVYETTVRRSAKFVQDIDAIAANVGQGVRDKILAREINVTERDVGRLARQNPEEQKAILNVVASGRAKGVVDARRLLNKERVAEPRQLTGQYRVIYADPPWRYGDQRDGATTGASDHYPTMSVSELCELSVKAIAEDDAVLFLWVTSPLLETSFAVVNAWGFRYKASFVWDKISHNMGHYNSVRHEFLLVCTRGSCTPDVPKLFDSVQSIQRQEHSKKPEQFREIIDAIYPHGNRIELFARRPAKGWEVWGNDSNLPVV